MKVKRYKEFLENAESTSVSGMGAVVAAQPGTLPGTTGTEGSGDIGFTFKKEKREKGGPSEVTDLRDLEDSKEINKVEDIKENLTLRKRDPAYDDETRDNIYDCLSELLDSGFQVIMIDYDSERMSMDLDDEETGYFDDELLKIRLFKIINKNWTGNILAEYEFNKEVSKLKDITISEPLPTSKTWEKGYDDERKIVEILEDICLKMVNILDYNSGEFKVLTNSLLQNGNRNINCNISITMRNIFKYQ